MLINNLPTIVSASWLQEHKGDPDLVILDASIKSVSSDSENDDSNVVIKGAKFFDLKGKFRNLKSEYPNTIPSADQFQKECRALGINHNSKIVIYDNLGIYSSPRAWWLYRFMGYKDVAVLDGGLIDWKLHNYPISETYETKTGDGTFIANLDHELVTFYEDVVKNIDTQECQVLDARSEGRFNGTSPEPRSDIRGGCIPNSVNLPFSKVLDNNKFKSEEELLALFNNLLKPDQKLIFSCGSGITACIIMLAAHLVLDNKMSIYDGSWTEWALRYN